MATLRVLNRVKFCGGWGNGLKGKLGLLSRSSSCGSILDRDSIFHSHFPSINQSYRHYFLPPPPVQIVLFGTHYGGHYPVSSKSGNVLSLAENAVKRHNKTSGGDLLFVRVVRASQTVKRHRIYCLTFEAFDKKASELNVYYAEVYDHPFKKMQFLMRLQLVDESFYYLFEEFRSSEHLRKRKRLGTEREKNKIVAAWLYALAPPCPVLAYLDPVLGARILDPLRRILDFEKKSMWNSDGCGSGPPENASDPSATDASDFVATVYFDGVYQKIYRYASEAVWNHNENEDDDIHLEEVLWASKSEVEKGAHYFLLLEAMDKKKDLNFYYAIIKAQRSDCTVKVELMEWYPIDASSHPPQTQ